jgi:alpha-mannosidase
MALILRAWNITGEPIEASVTLPSFIRSARRVRLDEQEIPDATLDWNPGPPPSVAVTLGAREILTLRLEL